MRDGTNNWLEPMLQEADKRPEIDVPTLIQEASMPAAKADRAFLDEMVKNTPEAKVSAIDWVRFGEPLRHKLGWDEKYPAYPDFPESRHTP